jgi:eukaryotic-like serine/threonine-protein kinase
MATVYLGRAEGTDKLVALKVIRDELAQDEQFANMFIDEAKILARLSHPNVIQTLEYGITGAHRFIAMELLNGRTAADVFEALSSSGDRLDFGVAAWICARVAEGLHSAHELVDESGAPLSVIHRDVNPSNIFLTYTGEVKLIDFGLARARVRLSKSAEGVVKGKIPYLAPEQAFGQPIDRRIDIYALGTTLWELSTMRRLFKRESDIDTLKAIRDAVIPNLREENPDFPEALWKIIDRSLRRERDERYGSAEEMRADLDAFARATGPHGPEVAALISNLFPGAEALQAKWLRDAASVSRDGETATPPAPVPFASSSLMDEDAPHSVRAPTLSAGPPPPPPRRAPIDPAPAPAADPPKKKKTGKHKKRAAAKAEPAPAPAAENTNRLWKMVLLGVAILIAIAAAASR